MQLHISQWYDILILVIETAIFIASSIVLVGSIQRWLKLRHAESGGASFVRVFNITYEREPHLTFFKWRANCKSDLGGGTANYMGSNRTDHQGMWMPTKGLARHNLICSMTDKFARWNQPKPGQLAEEIMVKGMRWHQASEADQAMEVLARGKAEEREDKPAEDFASYANLIYGGILSPTQGAALRQATSEFVDSEGDDGSEDEEEDEGLDGIGQA